MTEPVTATETADLLHRLRRLSEHHSTDPREQATVLALKAELLARIANQRAHEWGKGDDGTEAREIAREAQTIAENARRLAASPALPGANSQENSPRF